MLRLTVDKNVFYALSRVADAFGDFKFVELFVANHPARMLERNLLQHVANVAGSRNENFFVIGSAC